MVTLLKKQKQIAMLKDLSKKLFLFLKLVTSIIGILRKQITMNLFECFP